MNPNNNWLKFFASHPTASTLLMVSFIFLGSITIMDVRRETFPDFTPTEVEILVPYPGAHALEIDEAISQRIENVLENVNDVYEVKSESKEGISRIVVEMREGGNLNQFMDDIKTEVEAIDDFPDRVEKPIIKQLGRMDLVVSVAITGPMSTPDLKLFCEDIKNRLLLLDEISHVNVEGFSDHQIQIQLRAKELMRFGLSIVDITEAIAKQNIDLPAGTIETPEGNIIIRFSEERKSVSEYEDILIISGTSGEEIRLGDIAFVEDRFERHEEKIWFNGQRAGMLTIKKLKSEDSLKIIAALNNFLEKERKKVPPNVNFELTKNMTDIVQDRLTMLSKNGIQGLFLVFLSLWLFFSLRLAFWVTMGLPVAFLGTIFFMHHIDFSINMLTMVGLLLALGLIMDDAIVISENIASHYSKGKSALEAAVQGTQEVTPGVLSSFLTTLAIFGAIPIFIKGEMGKVLWVMPVVLILALSISLIEAFCILPHHLHHTFQKIDSNITSDFRKKFEKLLETFRENILGSFVDWAIRWRYLFIGILIFVFLFTLGLISGGKLKIIGFPEIDGDVLQARILLPQGTPIEKTESVVEQVVQALDKVNLELTPIQPGNQPLVQNTNVQFNTNLDAFETGTHVATVSVDLLKAEIRNSSLDEISKKWRESLGEIPDVINITYKEPQMGPGGLPIEIRLMGKDLDELKKASLELSNWLNGYEGVLDLNDDMRPGKPEIKIRMKRGAMAKGLNASLIANQLRAAFFGKTASEIQVGSEAYEIDVRLADVDQNSFSDLELFYITDPSGKLYPIGEVAVLEQSRGPARIFRVNGLKTITIRADLDSKVANAKEIIDETKKKFFPDFLKKYPGILYSFEGQLKGSKITGQSMMTAFLVGIFGVFVLLSFQLKSYVESLVVLSAIPLSLIGIIWGHVAMGLDLSMVSIMGFVSLSGVVINDSILLVQFIKMRLEQGEKIEESARKASRQRFRAVLLTSLTTIAGLTPLLLEKSLQAQVLIPLVTSIIFGLMASTLLVLIVIPSFYSILGDFKNFQGNPSN